MERVCLKRKVRRGMKKIILKKRRKCNFYRTMEIASEFVMVYGFLHMAAVEGLSKAVPETSFLMIVIGCLIGVAVTGLGYLMRRLFHGLRIMEMKEWKEDEKRVLKRVA